VLVALLVVFVIIVVVVCLVVGSVVAFAVDVGVVGGRSVIVRVSDVVGWWRVGVVLGGVVVVGSVVVVVSAGADSEDVGSVLGLVLVVLAGADSEDVGSVVGLVLVVSAGTDSEDVGFVGGSPVPSPASFASDSKMSLGILAPLRSWEKVPLALWYANALSLLAGVVTALLALAQAILLGPLGSRDAPSH